MNITIARIRDNAKIPFKKHVNDAGYDLYWAPSDKLMYSAFLELNGKTYNNATTLHPHTSKRFETGLRVNFPHGFAMKIENRSGIASKKDLLIGACIIDSTYAGEVIIDLHNVSDEIQVIEEGERIAQFVVYPIEHCVFEEVTVAEYEKETSQSTRGTGGFGSTGGK